MGVSQSNLDNLDHMSTEFSDGSAPPLTKTDGKELNNGQKTLTPEQQKIEDGIKPYLKNQVGTLLIIRNGQIYFERGYGYSDLSKRIENSAETQYQILSAQKAITAQMIMKMVETNKLSLSDKIDKYYPELESGDRLEIKNLLNMTSGLVMSDQSPSAKKDAEIVDRTVSRLTSNGKIGKWDYIDQNYVLLTGIIGKITGKSYEELFNEDFKKPLGLSSAGFVYNHTEMPHLATGYYFKNQNSYDGPVHENDLEKYSELGAGNIAMTTHDFYKLLSSILQNKFASKNSNQILHALGTSTSGYSGGMYQRKNYYILSGRGYGFEVKIKISSHGDNAVLFFSNSEPDSDDYVQQNLVSDIYKHEFKN